LKLLQVASTLPLPIGRFWAISEWLYLPVNKRLLLSSGPRCHPSGVESHFEECTQVTMPFDHIKKLGQGAFGEVWLANRDQRLVAVKYLRVPEQDHLARLAREVRILWEQLDNRYVVDLIDHNLGASPPYFVMEYCAGGSLREWVQQRRSSEHIVAVLSHAAQGLAGIHQRGGFHRDIKPENLLLTKLPDEKVQVKVADFGLARLPASGSSITRSPAGTPGYMAPEVALEHPYHSSADIFSLGVVGIELLTGSRDISSLKQALAPEGLKELLRRMVSASPSMRPSIEQVALELERLWSARVPTDQPIQQAFARSTGGGKTGGGLGLGGLLLAGLGILALASDNKTKWDASVGRYRGPGGRFRSK
jgi:serine/threonine protein kinase